MGAVDVAALLVAVAVSAAITAVLALFANTGTRRDWLVTGVMALVLMALGIVDLLNETPRETHLATAVVGALFPTAGGMALARATYRTRPWLRWLVVFLTAFVLLLGGMLLGASILPRFLGA